MDDNLDDIFDREVEENSEAETVETANNETVETVEKIEEPTVEVATQTVTETDPTKTAEATEEQTAGKRTLVPLAALQAQRARAQAEAQARQEEAQRVAELEKRLRDFEEQDRQRNAPDPWENPADNQRYLLDSFDQRLEQKLREREAENQQRAIENQRQARLANLAAVAENYTVEQRQEALDYAAARSITDDAWGDEGLKQADPFAWFLAEKNRHAQFEEFSRDPEGFKARIIVEAGLAATENVAATQPHMAARATHGLASAGSAAAANPSALSHAESIKAIFDNKDF